MNIVENKRKIFALVLSGSIIAISFILLVGFSSISYFWQIHNLKNDIQLSIRKIQLEENEIEIFINQEQKKQQENFKQSQEEIEIENILSSIKNIWENPDDDININPYLSGEQSMSIKPFSEVFPFLQDPVVIEGNSNNILLYSNILSGDIPSEDIFTNEEGFSSNSDYVFFKQSLSSQKYIIVLKKIEYTKTELLKNIGNFTLLLGILGFILFLLSYYIAKIILHPIEENIQEMEYFIDNAGHELKTPLAVIQSSGDLMKEVKEYNSELLEEIVGETKKAALLIDGLRSLSKLTQKKETSKCNLREIIENITKRYSKNGTYIEIHGENIYYIGNENHLRILLSNLIGNAIKYNTPEGKVDIYLEEKSITISDTGIGIPKKELKRIFSRFYRVKNHKNQREGFGLGLAMVKKICDVYGYKITVKSQENIGSHFTIQFPKKLGKI